jgi:hypothetical protein
LIEIRLCIRQYRRSDELIFGHNLTVVRAVDFPMTFYEARFGVGDVDVAFRCSLRELKMPRR